MPEPGATPAACGFRHDEWDGPYRMPRRCTAPAGHSDGQFAYDHGPWECLPLGWRDQPTDGTTSGTSGRTETGATIANPQAGAAAVGDTGADAGASGFTWAQSVASYGTGPTVTIDIDIHAPGHTEPVPVEIPLADARTLHAMLGGVLAEYGGETVTPESKCAHRSWELRRPSGWADDMPPGYRVCTDCEERLPRTPPADQDRGGQ